MHTRLVLVATAVALSTGTLAGQAQAPAMDTLLSRAGTYVAHFIDRFSNVVSEERFVQDLIGKFPPISATSRSLPVTPASKDHRVLRSDFLLVQVTPGNWLPFRDVFELDGQAVRDRESRLATLFLAAGSSDSAIEQASIIARESARYNLGPVERTVNMPILALTFLQRELQSRFHFEVERPDPTTGEHVWVVTYREVTRPTLVRGLNQSDVPASGKFWIDAEAGRVMRTELDLDTAGIHAHLSTAYRRDDSFDIDVPFEMQERYTHEKWGRITGTATYSRFRRFDVTSDETIHHPTLETLADPMTGMTLVAIPAGRFTMGSPPSEPERRIDETAHDVTIDRAFFLGEHEVTQKEWQTVMGNNPSRFAACGSGCPVENVSFADVTRFLAALNAQPRRELAYRLPTEAEWEYACRAGSDTPFWSGDTLPTSQANYNGKQPYSKSAEGQVRGRTVAVATLGMSEWGLADMHGNVAEWTADWYAPYASADVTDPRGPAAGERRVVRGGSWQSSAGATRCAMRTGVGPSSHENSLGFRVAADRVEASQAPDQR